MKTTNAALLVGTLVFLVGSVPKAIAQPQGVTGYEAIGLSHPHHGVFHESALANDGTIVGRPDAAVWRNGTTYLLERPRAGSGGYGIAPSGRMVCGQIVVGDDSLAAVWTLEGGREMLPVPLNTHFAVALAANDAGWAVGGAAPWVQYRAIVWSPNGRYRLIGGFGSMARAINDANEIVGEARLEPGSRDEPVIWRGGRMTLLSDYTGGESGYAADINNRSEVIGRYNQPDLPFYWYADELTFLPMTSQCFNRGGAVAINDAGLIVGNERFGDCYTATAVLWERLTPLGQSPPEFAIHRLVDLTLPFEGGPLELDSGTDVNDAGQVLAHGLGGDDPFWYSFLLTPYRFTLSAPSPGQAGTVNTIEVAGLDPGQPVRLAWGTGHGAQKINDCPGGTLLIQQLAGTTGARAADADGVVRFEFFVPDHMAGQEFRIQAIDVATCQISHTVKHVFD